MPKKSINEKLLIQLMDEGHDQKTIAKMMNCSEGGISRRLSVIRKRAVKPASLQLLTPKEQKFVQSVTSGGMTNTDAAMVSFDCTTRESAKTIGSRLSRQPEIIQAITEVLETEGITRHSLARSLNRCIQSEDENIVLRSTVEGFKLFDSYPAARNINTNANLNMTISPVDLTKYQ